MSVQLQKVGLVKTETCLTYVLKRLGLPEDMCTFENYSDYFDQYHFSRVKKLKRGDIILWDKDTTWKWLPWVIDENGVRWKNVPVHFHFGIMEDSDSFTDCTRLVQPPHPSLRYRKIADLQRRPDWVLRPAATDIHEN